MIYIIEKCFTTGEKPKITTPAYPQGLFLYKIKYPYFDMDTRETTH